MWVDQLCKYWDFSTQRDSGQRTNQYRWQFKKTFLYRIYGISSKPEVRLPFESCLTLPTYHKRDRESERAKNRRRRSTDTGEELPIPFGALLAPLFSSLQPSTNELDTLTQFLRHFWWRRELGLLGACRSPHKLLSWMPAPQLLRSRRWRRAFCLPFDLYAVCTWISVLSSSVGALVPLLATCLLF